MTNKNSRPNDNQRLYYLSFNHFAKIGPNQLQKLENYFSDLEPAFKASRGELEKAGLRSKISAEFLSWRKSFDLNRAVEELEKEKIKFITWHEPDYPPLLKEIPAAPPLLYYKGILSGELKSRLAVVGSRQPSAYAEKLIDELLPEVMASRIDIVSGLALGVDSLAHRAALKHGGPTLAVLGSGLNSAHIYPRHHCRLAEEIIADGGALISEFSPSTPAYKQNFPQRNRLISGLCQATLVIEAQARSGSLITANYALEQNREVLAVPGNIFSEFSIGTNQLIKVGAKTVVAAADILEVFGITSEIENPIAPSRAKTSYRPKDKIESAVYNIIKKADERSEKITTDEIIKLTKLDTSTINSTLSILEIRGIIRNNASGYDLY